MAVEESRVVQCAQYTHILALPYEEFLHLNVEVSEFDSLFAEKEGFGALECEGVVELIRNA
jgi:hypothetical protein